MKTKQQKAISLVVAMLMVITTVFGNSFAAAATAKAAEATPMVTANVANGTVFYEDITGDYMNVTLTLNNAVSGTYSVDKGPVKTFTKSANVKVGIGKIPDHTPITVDVTATNGAVTNIQTFTYYKSAKNLSIKAAKISAKNMKKSAVNEQQVTVYFQKPTDWESEEAPRVYAYYTVDDKTTATGKKIMEPAGAWPGNTMEEENDGWYSCTFSGTNSAKVIFTVGAKATGKIDEETGKPEYDVEYRTPEEFATETDENGKPVRIEGYDVKDVGWFNKNGETTKPAVLPFSDTVRKINFQVPESWSLKKDETPYVYVYYTAEDKTTDTGERIVEPAGAWPGTKMTHSNLTSNNWYNYEINGSENVKNAKVIFLAGVTQKAEPNPVTGKAEYNVSYRTPEEYEEKLNPVTGQMEQVKKEGYAVSKENAEIWFDETGNEIENPFPTVVPSATPVISQVPSETPTTVPSVTPTAIVVSETPVASSATPTVTPTNTPTATATTAPTPTVTPSNELRAIFGAENSAPQYLTRVQKLKMQTAGGVGTLTYTFIVDSQVIYTGLENSTNWNTSVLNQGDHVIQGIVKDESGKSVVLTKVYNLEAVSSETPVESIIPVPTNVTSTVTPSATVSVPDITAVPTATVTPVVTVEPTATVTVTLPATTKPAVSVTPEATVTPVPTAPVITGEPVVPGDPVENLAVSKIKFSKKITAGETVKIKTAAKGGSKSGYKYTYTITNNKKKSTVLVKNTKKTSVNWTPVTAGKYTVKVTVKDSNGTKVSKKVSYKVKKRVITVKSLNTNKKSGQKAKTKIKVTAKATTTKGKVSYKFTVKPKNGKEKVLKGYSKKASVTWKPTKKGTYTISVLVKNGKGVVVTKTKKFVVK